MIFVTLFLLGIGIHFLLSGIRAGDQSTKAMGFAFLIGAIATGLVSALALSIMNSV